MIEDTPQPDPDLAARLRASLAQEARSDTIVQIALGALVDDLGATLAAVYLVDEPSATLVLRHRYVPPASMVLALFGSRMNGVAKLML